MKRIELIHLIISTSTTILKLKLHKSTKIFLYLYLQCYHLIGSRTGDRVYNFEFWRNEHNNRTDSNLQTSLSFSPRNQRPLFLKQNFLLLDTLCSCLVYLPDSIFTSKGGKKLPEHILKTKISHYLPVNTTKLEPVLILSCSYRLSKTSDAQCI